MKEALTFDDVSLVPQYSTIRSRDECSIGVEIGKGQKLSIPILSSPMDTVTEDDMCDALQSYGTFGVMHRYNTIDEQVALVNRFIAKSRTKIVAAAIGVTGDYLERSKALISAGVEMLCVDVAHGHHILVHDAIKALRDEFGDSIHIMAGNVATSDGFHCLAKWGADSVRVGVGSGSICSTRMQTGHGVPNLSVIMDCYQCKKGYSLDVGIIADGGIRKAGDIVKALAAGADAVMCGSLLSGTDEAPGEILEFPEGRMKSYRGMASYAAQKAWRGKSSAPEGVATHVPYKGSVKPIIDDLIGNVKSGLSYSGARNVMELREKAEWVKQTRAGIDEGFTHILMNR